MDLIDRLQAIREERGISNRAFSRLLGINHALWARASARQIRSNVVASAAIRVFPELREEALAYLTDDAGRSLEPQATVA